MEKINSKDIGTVGKIIIPKNIENIIDVLHRRVGATEWSGILFYRVTKGNIKNLKNLEFTVDFIYPMNIGSTSYTEFDFTGEIMDAYEIKEDLIECNSGLCHTHHNMAAFYSSTDTDELLSNAKNFNYYVSLIVNFSKEYKCKVAFPSKSVVNTKHIIKDNEGNAVTFTSKKEVIEILVGDLDIEMESQINEEKWLADRIVSLKKTKAAKSIPNLITPNTYSQGSLFERSFDGYSGLSIRNSFNSKNSVSTLDENEFLSALLNLDVSKKNIPLYQSLKQVSAIIKEEEIQLFIEALELNIEIIYSDLYPNDVYFADIADVCNKCIDNIKMYVIYNHSKVINKIINLLQEV